MFKKCPPSATVHTQQRNDNSDYNNNNDDGDNNNNNNNNNDNYKWKRMKMNDISTKKHFPESPHQ